jgi:hypothetical protein
MTIIHNFLFIFLLFYAAKVGIPLQTNEHFAKINAFSAIRQPLSILEMPFWQKRRKSRRIMTNPTRMTCKKEIKQKKICLL